MRRYAFDVDPDSLTFLNRRIFAYADTGIPDGIQIDKNGNVYAGCGDGVQVSVIFSALHPSFFLACFPFSYHAAFFWNCSYLYIFFHCLFVIPIRHLTRM